jgi:hypothetical protein
VPRVCLGRLLRGDGDGGSAEPSAFGPGAGEAELDPLADRVRLGARQGGDGCQELRNSVPSLAEAVAGLVAGLSG